MNDPNEAAPGAEGEVRVIKRFDEHGNPIDDAVEPATPQPAAPSTGVETVLEHPQADSFPAGAPATFAEPPGLEQQLVADFEHIAADSRAVLSRLEEELGEADKRLAVHLHDLLEDLHVGYHMLRSAPAAMRVAFLSALNRLAYHAEKPR